MTAPRRPGGALLIGLAVGALLIGLSTLVGGVRPASADLDAAAPSSSAPPLAALPAADPASAGAPGGAGAGPGAPAPAAAAAPAPALTTGSGGGRPAGTPAVVDKPRVAATTTTRATRAAAPRPAATGLTGPEQQVVTLTNTERAEAGCDPLTVDARLTAAARGHSADMSANDYFDHDSQDGRTFADRETAAGYPNPGGENIAYGQKTAAEVMNDWMNSDGHRRNILDCSFTTIGVGLATKGMYWTQNFGR